MSPFYLAAKVSRLSGMCLVWAVLLLGICLLTSPAHPQDVLWGLTSNFGPKGAGTAFSLKSNGTDFTVRHAFKSEPLKPKGGLTQGSDGYFYGMTQSSDHYGSGSTIFKVASDGSNFTVLRYFNSTNDGTGPRGNLIEGSDGYFYGTTYRGGFYDSGTIFKLSADGTDFTVLKSYNLYTDGMPSGSLIEGNDGYLYGVTGGVGGNYSNGTIFKMSTDGTGFTVLKDSIPFFSNGILIEGSDSYFYGVTEGGGTYGHGTIFKIAPDGTDLTVLKHFQGSTHGSGPSGGLMEGSDGYLYGMAGGGISNTGIIYKIAPDGTGFTVLHNFGNYPYDTGAYPIGNLTSSGGYLYGLTSMGTQFEPDCSDYGCYLGSGAMFSIAPDGTGYSVQAIFPYIDYAPSSTLTKDRDGHLYGTAFGYPGGQPSSMIYRNSHYNVLKIFDYMTEGIPVGNLTPGSDGYLYGTASMDEYNGGDGTFFRIATDGSGFTILKYFDTSTDGISPEGSLVEGSDGYFYGTTSSGGNYDAGTIYKIASDGSGFSIVRSFNPSTDGASPTGLIIQKGKKGPLPALQVNFQNKYTQTPAGWLKDYGLPFSEKQLADSSLTYGWKRRDTAEPINLSVGGNFPGNEGNGRWRPTPSDPLLATLMHMQGNDVKNFRGTPVESYWEMAVENGDYQVTVSVGDGYRYTYSDPESHSINVEGMPAITHFIPQGPSGSQERFKQNTVIVTVSDGYLTLDADGGTNTKINYAIIQPLSGTTAIARKDFSAQGAESQAHLRAYPNPFIHQLKVETNLRGNVSITLFDLMGNSNYQANHQLQTAQLEVDLSALELKSGIYLLKLQAEDGRQQLIKIVKR